MAHSGRRLAQAERACGLDVGKLLEVAQENDLAIGLVEPLERSVESSLHFAANGRGGGREFGVAKLSGEVERRPIGERASTERLLAIKAARRGDAVAAILIDHMVAGDLAEPEVKRQCWIAKVVGKPLIGLEQDLLDDVAGVDPTGQRVVESQADHAPQGRAVPLPESFRRLGIVLLDALQKYLRFNRVGPHRSRFVSRSEPAVWQEFAPIRPA